MENIKPIKYSKASKHRKEIKFNLIKYNKKRKFRL